MDAKLDDLIILPYGTAVAWAVLRNVYESRGDGFEPVAVRLTSPECKALSDYLLFHYGGTGINPRGHIEIAGVQIQEFNAPLLPRHRLIVREPI